MEKIASKYVVKFQYKYLVYLSLVFLAVVLYRTNYLGVPEIVSWSAFTGSFTFLFAGFISSAISWKQILAKSDHYVTSSECLAGIGLSIFGKYIPGKIWTIVGRASYIAEKRHYPVGRLSAISLNAQLIALWLGLTLGVIGLFILGGFHLFGWLIFLLWLGLTVVIFSKLVHGIAERLVRVLLRKDIEIPTLTIKSTVSVMPWFILYWMLWSIGFYLLVVSLTLMNVPYSVGLGFPLAGTLGIMALIAPGGLGAREGVIIAYLTLAGFPVAEATAISVISRLWFLVGDVFIFIVGWVAHKRLGYMICKDNEVQRDI